MFVLSCENLSRGGEQPWLGRKRAILCKWGGVGTIRFVPNYILWLFFQRQDSDYEYDYSEQDESEAALGLPSDSSSIRENIGNANVHTPVLLKVFKTPSFLHLVDEFTCEGKVYGYYADVANECQIFHICYPVTYADGVEEMLKWSFICPNGTIFDQVLFSITVSFMN